MGRVVPFAAPSPPAVEARVAGTARYEPRRFCRILGESCFRTWVGLLWRRDRDGTTRARNSTIATSQKLSIHQVNRGCRRLRAAGLLHDIATVPHGTGVMVLRQILGDYRGGEVTVPAQAARAIEDLPLNGGHRMSGKTQEAERATPRAERATPPTRTRNPPHQNAQHEILRAGIKGPFPPLAPLQEMNERTAGGAVPFLTSGEGYRGLGVSNTGLPYRPPANGIPGLVPPYPDNVRLGAARLPSPPALPGDLPTIEQVWRLIYAYRGAVQRSFGEGRPLFASVESLRASKHYPALVEAAGVLVEYQIPPISWACWAVEIWTSGGEARKRRTKVPPLTWVWGANCIRERRGWWRSEAAAFDGGKIFQGPLQQEYRRRYNTVRVRLARLTAEATEAEIRAVVATVFPDGWEDLIERARAENLEMQGALEREVARGRWYW